MFPHFLGFDFSAALPWIAGGFLLGVMLTALWRGLGSSRAGSAQLQTALYDLNALRITRDEREAFTARLQSDFGFLEMALADAEQRAGSVLTLTSANASLSRAEAENLARFAAATAELATLKSALQAQTTRSTTLEQRLQFIAAENTAASAASETRARELEKLRSDLAATEARAREIEKLRTELAAAANALQDVPKLKSEYIAAASEIEMLRSELDKRGAVSAGSKRDYDTAMQDLIATRNLTIKQAADIKVLSAACAKLEAVLGTKAPSPGRSLGFAGRTQGLKTRRRNAFRKVNGHSGSGKRVTVKAKSNSSGVATGRSTLPVSGATFLSKAGKWRGAAMQSGAGRVWAVSTRGGAHGNVLNGAENSSAHGDGSDTAMLKARVASLSEELENYRRLRDAVVAANRIAAGDA